MPTSSVLRLPCFLASAIALLVLSPSPQSHAAPSNEEPTPGIVRDWKLSPTLRASDLAPESYLDGKSAADLQWLSVTSEDSGWIDIGHYRQLVPNTVSKVWARTIIHAKAKESRPYGFGYHENMAVYLNGRILYTGRSDFHGTESSNHKGKGWNDIVYLQLEEGENELALRISDQGSDWGFKARDMYAIYQHPGLTQVWDLPSQFNAPESVAYDPVRHVLYVSNFGDGSISKIGLDGKILVRDWVTGLKAPTGMKFFAGNLYAVERPGIAVIDPETGGIANRDLIPGSSFPNDLAIDGSSAIYVTDTFGSCVFKLSGGKSEVWISGDTVKNPNGILVEKGRLLVGVSSDSSIKIFDLSTKQSGVLLMLNPGANMDGLISDGQGGYLFSDYYGRIYASDSNGQKTLLLDRSGPKQYCADFEFIPDRRLLVVPSLYDNRVTAYEYDTTKR